MADLVTHVCSGLLPASLAPARWAPVVAVGTVLPDAMGRAVPMALEVAQGWGLGVPDWLIWPWTALHTPVGIGLSCAAVALCFVPRDRTRVLLGLWVGGGLHLLLDVMQSHHSQGYPLLAPVSWRTYEVGWIGSEATVPWALPLLACTAGAWGIRWLLHRRGQGRATDQENSLRPPSE